MNLRVVLPKNPTLRQIATYKMFLCELVMELPQQEWEARMGRPLTFADLLDEMERYTR